MGDQKHKAVKMVFPTSGGIGLNLSNLTKTETDTEPKCWSYGEPADVGLEDAEGRSQCFHCDEAAYDAWFSNNYAYDEDI